MEVGRCKQRITNKIMKKNIFFSLALLFSAASFAQVGIGTTTPASSAILDLTSTDKGLLLPRVANTAAVTAPTNGMMIYDLSAGCIRSYENGAWTSCLSIAPTQVVRMNDANSVLNGTFSTTTAISGTANYLKVELANDSFAAVTFTVSNADVVLAGANTGLSVTKVATTAAGTAVTSITIAAVSTGTLYYVITGTPTTQGTLTATWTKGVLSALRTAPVCYPDPSNTTTTATIAELGTKALAATPAGGTWTVVSGGGSIAGTTYTAPTVSSDTPVTLAYTVPASGEVCTERGSNVSFTIKDCPAAANNTTYRNAIAEGDTKNLTATPAGGTWSVVSGVGSITGTTYTAPTVAATTAVVVRYTMTALPCATTTSDITFNVVDCVPIVTSGTSLIPVSALAPFNTRALVATPAGGTWTMVSGGGTITGSTYTAPNIAANDVNDIVLQYTTPCSTMATITFQVYGSAFIFDRNFTDTSHQFIYKTVTGADGKTWLNNNLGADYAKLNHPSFNPAKQATTRTDYLAYGSLFQWGRKADGHELINYTNATTATAIYGTTTTLANVPANALFITNSTTPWDWRVSQDDTLWATEASANNPCPAGFRVPTLTELNALITAASITTSASAASSSLKFSVSGRRTNTLFSVGSNGSYWSSSVSGINSGYCYFDSGTKSTDNFYRSIGFSVRCIKD